MDRVFRVKSPEMDTVKSFINFRKLITEKFMRYINVLSHKLIGYLSRLRFKLLFRTSYYDFCVKLLQPKTSLFFSKGHSLYMSVRQ